VSAKGIALMMVKGVSTHSSSNDGALATIAANTSSRTTQVSSRLECETCIPLTSASSSPSSGTTSSQRLLLSGLRPLKPNANTDSSGCIFASTDRATSRSSVIRIAAGLPSPGGRIVHWNCEALWRFAARTRNGFTPVVRANLMKRFKGLETSECRSPICPRRRPDAGAPA
jgi:hypothetical protein